MVEEQRLAAKDLEETKVKRAKAEQVAAEARLAALQAAIRLRREAAAAKQEEALERARQRWLQTIYPAQLGRGMIETFRALSAEAKSNFAKTVDRLHGRKVFERQLFVSNLWEFEKMHTNAWCNVTPFTGGAPRRVSCGWPFQELIDKEAPQTLLGARDPPGTLLKLFDKCFPHARKVFVHHHSPLRMLHVNDYSMEKTFVYGIILLSKWMGADRFPHGIFGWPPPFPADLMAPSQDPTPAPFSVEDPPSHPCAGSASSSSKK